MMAEIPGPRRRVRSLWTRKRRLNAVLLVMFLGVFFLSFLVPIEWLGSLIPHVELIKSDYEKLTIAPAPYVTFWRELKFDSVGAFSAANKIQVSVLVYDVSIKNWTAQYCCFALEASGTDVVYQIGSNLNFTQVTGQPYADSHLGTAYFTVPQASQLWFGVVPSPINGTRDREAITSQTQSVLNVTSISDTLSLQFTESAIRLGLIFGSFSILFMHDVIEGIFLDENEH